ncbi:MAG: hypothetical protein V1875_03980 [Candidatus Altiarchaeota archaeon]
MNRKRTIMALTAAMTIIFSATTIACAQGGGENPPGLLAIYKTEPATNITIAQNAWFRVTLNVTCILGVCGPVTVTLDPTDQQANVTLNGTKNSGQFGYSVSTGDFNDDGVEDVLIGASKDGIGTLTGNAYIFYGRSGWSGNYTNIQANVTLNGTKDMAEFGGSVASGDFNGDGIDDAMIGSIYDGIGTSPGSAYIFYGRSDWSGEYSNLQANVTLNGTQDNSLFGGSVASGDFNGDGIDDAMVGATQDGIGIGRGIAYVFFGRNGLGGQYSNLEANLTLNGTKDFGRFGMSAAPGDFNGDNIDDVLVGASHDGIGNYKGNAYVFYGKSGWSGQYSNSDANVTLNGTKDSGYFGRYVASGDFNGDSIDDALVGAYQDGIGTNRGNAYVFYGKSGWSGQYSNSDANVTLNGTKDSGLFGYSVASGDFNGDTFDDTLIGAYQDGTGTNRGNAYVFYGKTGWSGQYTNAQANVTLNGTYDNGMFGSSISSGDLNGDGTVEALVGAYGGNGSVFVFDLLGETATKGIIPTSSGSPFWTNASANPVLTSSLYENESQLLTFWVNGTGGNGTYVFFAVGNTSDSTIGNFSQYWTITIQEAGANNAPYFGYKLIQTNNTYGKDTYIINGSGGPYGSERGLQTGRSGPTAYRGLVYVNTSAIPTNANVTFSRLSMYLYGGTYSIPEAVRNATSLWDEPYANWTYRTQILLWTAPGGDYT